MRRQINQGFLEKLFIDRDGEVARAELTEPFGPLLPVGQAALSAAREDPKNTDQTDIRLVGGVNETALVGDEGLEPPTLSV